MIVFLRCQVMWIYYVREELVIILSREKKKLFCFFQENYVEKCLATFQQHIHFIPFF